MTNKKRESGAAPAVRVAPLSEFRPNAANTREHDERNRQLIQGSLTQFGPARSIVAGPKGEIIAGNGTYEQAMKLGLEALVVTPAPNQLVVVDRSDLSAVEAAQLGVVDNRATDLSAMNDANLALVLSALDTPQRAAAGYSDEEFAELLAAVGPAPESGHDGRAGGGGSAGAGGGDFGSFPDEAPTRDYVKLSFGDYSGLVSRVVYDSFLAAYQARQREVESPMIDDVLRAWLGL